jgi:L-asparaginase
MSIRTICQPSDLLALARFLQQEMRDDVDGMVVTHGTDTLEEVVYFIDEVFFPQRPIVFTGAMRPAWAADYDGARNLEDAIHVASQAPGAYGALVTMNGSIFEAWSIYKADTGTLDAFTARRGAPIGRVTSEQIELGWRPTPRQRFGQIPATLPASVPILTMGVGDDAALLDRLAASSINGVVIAGMGAGSIPPAALVWILELTKTNIPVVLCSSAASGRTAEEEYYPGAYDELRAAGVVIENHLTARKARIRLLLSLGLELPYAPVGEEVVLRQ